MYCRVYWLFVVSLFFMSALSSAVGLVFNDKKQNCTICLLSFNRVPLIKVPFNRILMKLLRHYIMMISLTVWNELFFLSAGLDTYSGQLSPNNNLPFEPLVYLV